MLWKSECHYVKLQNAAQTYLADMFFARSPENNTVGAVANVASNISEDTNTKMEGPRPPPLNAG